MKGGDLVSIILAKENVQEEIWMRDVYCNTLMEMAEIDDRIVALDSDLMSSLGIKTFADRFPDRMINCGIQEANMIGIAAGLSATGKVPFAHSFGVFATRRCFDQVFISVAYARLNVRIIGTDPGVTATYNGGTHMPFEDVGIMRNIPGITIIEPVDSVMLKDLLFQLKDLYGVYYIRLARKNQLKIFEEGSRFEIGKAIELKNGKDVTLIVTGTLIEDALKAVKILEGEGISVKLVNMFTIKPVDREAVGKWAQETGAIVTVENHNIINGLGSAVAETLVETNPVPMERIGCRDEFGEVGSLEYLKERYEMMAEDIVKKVRIVLKRKRCFR
jgi:transketolase